MAQLAIKGHATRGNEVIEILEMLGGVNKTGYDGSKAFVYYFINDNHIDWCYECIPESNFFSFTLEEFLEKYPYKTGDNVICDDKECFITDVIWDKKWNYIKYKVFHTTKSLINGWQYVERLKPYKEKPMEDKGTLVEIDLTREETKAEEIEVILGDYEFVLKDGKTYFIKKKPQYPKTFVECCEILYPNENFQTMAQPIKGHNGKKLFTLQKLLICRDAYWKIAGEQMGLDKPWEPDWSKSDEIKHCITNTEGNITKWVQKSTNKILAFPTEEIRDAFKENFDDDIEFCKEFL